MEYLTGMRRATGTVLVAALVTVSDPVGADAAQRACRSVTVAGVESPVRATALSCTKARRIARRFAAGGHLPRGWVGVNPAGCEWVLMRRVDRDRVVGNGYQAPRGVPTVSTTRDRGCTS